MNALSAISPDYVLAQDIHPVWTSPVRMISTVTRVVYNAKEDELICPPGGAAPPGALGHVGAALELAEQVRQVRNFLLF
jgi:1-aminocyclopropane-1-carboxylate deaminase/D-cysteine desulfhydrase-like pyridoxal-dependent ACC family enzyme